MYHVIINPASRSGKGERLWREIVEPYLKQENISYQSYFSDTPGEVTTLTKYLTRDATPDNPINLVILGGDGTFNETIQGIQSFSSVILGYIPTGSSNDLARDLKIPKDPAFSVKQAFHSTDIHKMDVGVVTFPDGETRRFTVSCGIGFDAAVCEEANRSRFKKAFNKIGLGKLVYLAIAVKQLLTAKTVSCQVEFPERTIRFSRMLFLASMLHRYEGGGFLFAPDARDDDGILDICLAKNLLPKWVILLCLPTAFWGKHYMFPGIDAYHSDEYHIKTSAPLWIHTDGEILRKGDEMDICCMKQVARIRY